ncbi:MAG TPA: hypothetical protein VLU43_15135 [Anaeromyxobacteraceae bacterium]|nr:hypothetical protein [Anaeromyxobacteraceae bacterium]
MDRVSITVHQGKSVVVLDFKACKPADYAAIVAEATKVITAHPPKTARVISQFDEARFDPSVVLLMERFVRRVTPHMAANGLVGITGLRKVAFLGIRPLYKCPAELFDTLDAAKDWLASR